MSTKFKEFSARVGTEANLALEAKDFRPIQRLEPGGIQRDGNTRALIGDYYRRLRQDRLGLVSLILVDGSKMSVTISINALAIPKTIPDNKILPLLRLACDICPPGVLPSASSWSQGEVFNFPLGFFQNELSLPKGSLDQIDPVLRKMGKLINSKLDKRLSSLLESPIARIEIDPEPLVRKRSDALPWFLQWMIPKDIRDFRRNQPLEWRGPPES
ncbi:hypothetical protein EF888_19005 [Silicimonas algicola]|uniref:Uncharacterized protein n=1 Tax=Silicimonas algicola TaxID=1826607 RepID=A0A316GH49_9RHOB|nr:hypothetical protein [Silicimonas algicola]AZQ69035.1 hypothetical protein EF888_19005 [Silicimonas algicola]PWK54077.1 hypothetical protein C8D95_11265 [Silicimonas algicola]